MPDVYKGTIRIGTGDPNAKLPSDGEVERLIEEAYPGVLASVAFRKVER